MIYETPLAVSIDTIAKDVEQIFRSWTDGTKHLISHYLSPIEFRKLASFTGTDNELLEWVKEYPSKYGAIYVVTDHPIVYDMNDIRPELAFYQIVVRDDNSINIQKQVTDGIRQATRASETV